MSSEFESNYHEGSEDSPDASERNASELNASNDDENETGLSRPTSSIGQRPGTASSFGNWGAYRFDERHNAPVVEIAVDTVVEEKVFKVGSSILPAPGSSRHVSSARSGMAAARRRPSKSPAGLSLRNSPVTVVGRDSSKWIPEGDGMTLSARKFEAPSSLEIVATSFPSLRPSLLSTVAASILSSSDGDDGALSVVASPSSLSASHGKRHAVVQQPRQRGEQSSLVHALAAIPAGGPLSSPMLSHSPRIVASAVFLQAPVPQPEPLNDAKLLREALAASALVDDAVEGGANLSSSPLRSAASLASVHSTISSGGRSGSRSKKGGGVLMKGTLHVHLSPSGDLETRQHSVPPLSIPINATALRIGPAVANFLSPSASVSSSSSSSLPSPHSHALVSSPHGLVDSDPSRFHQSGVTSSRQFLHSQTSEARGGESMRSMVIAKRKASPPPSFGSSSPRSSRVTFLQASDHAAALDTASLQDSASIAESTGSDAVRNVVGILDTEGSVLSTDGGSSVFEEGLESAHPLTASSMISDGGLSSLPEDRAAILSAAHNASASAAAVTAVHAPPEGALFSEMSQLSTESSWTVATAREALLQTDHLQQLPRPITPPVILFAGPNQSAVTANLRSYLQQKRANVVPSGRPATPKRVIILSPEADPKKGTLMKNEVVKSVAIDHSGEKEREAALELRRIARGDFDFASQTLQELLPKSTSPAAAQEMVAAAVKKESTPSVGQVSSSKGQPMKQQPKEGLTEDFCLSGHGSTGGKDSARSFEVSERELQRAATRPALPLRKAAEHAPRIFSTVISSGVEKPGASSALATASIATCRTGGVDEKHPSAMNAPSTVVLTTVSSLTPPVIIPALLAPEASPDAPLSSKSPVAQATASVRVRMGSIDSLGHSVTQLDSISSNSSSLWDDEEEDDAVSVDSSVIHQSESKGDVKKDSHREHAALGRKSPTAGTAAGVADMSRSSNADIVNGGGKVVTIQFEGQSLERRRKVKRDEHELSSPSSSTPVESIVFPSVSPSAASIVHLDFAHILEQGQKAHALFPSPTQNSSSNATLPKALVGPSHTLALSPSQVQHGASVGSNSARATTDSARQSRTMNHLIERTLQRAAAAIHSSEASSIDTAAKHATASNPDVDALIDSLLSRKQAITTAASAVVAEASVNYSLENSHSSSFAPSLPDAGEDLPPPIDEEFGDFDDQRNSFADLLEGFVSSAVDPTGQHPSEMDASEDLLSLNSTTPASVATTTVSAVSPAQAHLNEVRSLQTASSKAHLARALRLAGNPTLKTAMRLAELAQQHYK